MSKARISARIAAIAESRKAAGNPVGKEERSYLREAGMALNGIIKVLERNQVKEYRTIGNTVAGALEDIVRMLEVTDKSERMAAAAAAAASAAAAGGAGAGAGAGGQQQVMI